MAATTLQAFPITKLITVTHPKHDLPTGLARRIYKLAGWRP
jgi:hypothetical protein